MADRHDSGSCVGNDVWVQVPFSALFTSYSCLDFERSDFLLFRKSLLFVFGILGIYFNMITLKTYIYIPKKGLIPINGISPSS